LKRNTRAQGIELGILVIFIQKSDWLECKDKPVVCIENQPIKHEIENTMPNPTICGEFGFILQEPVP
jgi:antimicrobial peptide system SdpA family protein